MATKNKPAASKPEGQEGKSKPAAKPKTFAGDYWQEWNVRIEGGKAIKTDISRKCVKITDEEAENLNRGILTGGNSYAKMYFKVKGEAVETPEPVPVSSGPLFHNKTKPI